MLKATAGKVMPTTITGSLPRPSWYTENLGLKSFLDAMVISRFLEEYVDALSYAPEGPAGAVRKRRRAAAAPASQYRRPLAGADFRATRRTC